MSIRSYKKNKGCLYRSRKNKKNQQKFRSNLSKTTRGEWEHKSEEQKNTINKLRMFCKAREKVITLFDDYTAIVCKAKYKAKHGKRLKISTLKQMLQRLLILLQN